jgi:hypothetical protein
VFYGGLWWLGVIWWVPCGGLGSSEMWGETMCREGYLAQGGGCAGVWKVMGKWGLSDLNRSRENRFPRGRTIAQCWANVLPCA